MCTERWTLYHLDDRRGTTGEASEAEAATLLRCFTQAGASFAASSADDAEADALFAARRLVYPALERQGHVLTEDVCVPRMLVPGVLARIAEVARDAQVQIATLAHAGDGNLHPMSVVPRGDEGARARAHTALRQVVDEALKVGGTVTGEHGVGLLKMTGLAAEVGPVVMQMHRSVKAAIDPAGIFNPGKVFL